MTREYVELDVRVRKATGRAIMIACEDADVDEQWIPLSVCDFDASEAEPEEGSEGTLMVEEWFAKREGLV